ncbi:MAG TPA: CAP domain-containing protein, partial [Burkholderiaceae bacterium]|nr:CAP domain-containing protein [Burkholderiaceae bacterium]
LRAVGENLAAGPLGLDEAFALWTSSEAHCSNLMRPDFEELGLACVAGSGRYERFWVLHLAAPARRF